VLLEYLNLDEEDHNLAGKEFPVTIQIPSPSPLRTALVAWVLCNVGKIYALAIPFDPFLIRLFVSVFKQNTERTPNMAVLLLRKHEMQKKSLIPASYSWSYPQHVFSLP